MRRPGARFRDSDGDRKVTVVGAVFVVVLFAFAHHIGVQYTAQQGFEKEEVLQKKHKAIQAEHAGCMRVAQQKMTRSAEADQLSMKHQELSRKMAATQQETETIKAETNDCEAALSLERDKWEAEQAKAKSELSEKTMEHERLSDEARVLVGKDAKTKLLVATLRKFAKENAKLHERLDTPLEKSAEDPEYIAELIEKWKKIDKERTEKGLKGPLSFRPNEIIPLEEEEKIVKPVALVDRYDPDIHAKTVFVLSKNNDGKWKIPGWNGRQGTNSIVKLGGAVEQIIPITTLNKNIRVIYKYALCGVGQNITGFMFPDKFKRCETCDVEYMRNYVETPVISFCDNCEPVHTLHAFKLLCNGFQDSVMYGGLLFWRARSRIRFRDSILDAAEQFQATLRTDGAKVLAVVVPGSKPDDCKKPTLAYQKLLKGRSDGVEEISADPIERCSPPMKAVVGAVEKYAKKIRAEHGDPAIYISAPHWTDEDFSEFRSHSKLFPFKKNIERYPGNYATNTDAVDTMVAAWSDVVIVDRFSMKGVQVIENHLLLNDLKGKEIVVW